MPASPSQAAEKPLVRATDLARTFDVSPPWLNRVLEGKPKQLLRAGDGVSFDIERGTTLALVGGSVNVPVPTGQGATADHAG